MTRAQRFEQARIAGRATAMVDWRTGHVQKPTPADALAWRQGYHEVCKELEHTFGPDWAGKGRS